uniref:T9SS sorting signal type C domain-containing protein n=1 Tax=Flavobacterium sp. Root935 TaxID=1736610 RepID=UPI00397748D4
MIYNILGQEIFNKKKINSTEFQISNLQTGNQVLLLKINLQNGHSTSKKIIMD